MTCGFAQNQYGGKTLEYFRHMISSFKPNEISIVSLLCACTHLRNLSPGMEVHGYIFHFRFSDNIFIASALVDMYSKCGRLDIAIQVIENSQEKTVGIDNSAEEEKQINHKHQKLHEKFKSRKTTEPHINPLLPERLQERRRESSPPLYTMTITD